MRLRIEEDVEEDVWGLLIDIEVHEGKVPTARDIAKKHLKRTAKEYHDGTFVSTIAPKATAQRRGEEDENLLRST